MFIKQCLSILFIASNSALCANVEQVMPPTLVDAVGDRNVFSTPIDYRNGQIFLTQVEPAVSGGSTLLGLQTVVLHGINKNGTWTWQRKVIEPNTMQDEYHAQSSLIVDRDGYIHVAYNMHNMPWQYSVSKKPYDISEFIFRGQQLTTSERVAVKINNLTPFPTPGEAAIPGNQVTYPAFFRDRIANIYVSYRFATKPARDWFERGFAGGVARYDIFTKKWLPIGPSVQLGRDDALLQKDQNNYISFPLIQEDKTTVYLPVLAFDSHNRMHIVWHWRNEQAGRDVYGPSYAYSSDLQHFYSGKGGELPLPIKWNGDSQINGWSASTPFNAPKSLTIGPADNPTLVTHPLNRVRQLSYFSNEAKAWSSPIDSPYGAQQVLWDKNGDQWAFASGITVSRRIANSKWEKVASLGSDLCYPSPIYSHLEHVFIVRAKTCDGSKSVVYKFTP